MENPILILGATSGIGRLAMEEALKRGHRVRAFARSAEKLEPAENLEIVAGDALSDDDLEAAVKGAHAVVYALGVKERPAMLWENETLFSELTKLLLKAMESAGVKRLMTVTGFGAGRSRDAMSSLEKLGHGAILGRVYADKTRQEALIMESSADWTIVRPVILTNRPASGHAKILIDPKNWRNGLVSRGDVANYLIDAVEDDLNVCEDVVITR